MSIGLQGIAHAQSTVTINKSQPDVFYSTIRGGSFANTTLATTLETRASDNAEYLRRGLLKFDTQNLIAQGAAVTSAILTLTVKQASGDPNRSIAVYQVTTSWDETQVNWNRRRSSDYWLTKGADLGTKLAEKVVGNAVGTTVSFDVTALVRQAVSGQLGSSRYTRLALLDNGTSTSESWRSYYTTEEADAALRPTLTVTLGTAAPAPPLSSPPPPPAAPTGSTLRVLHWNIAKNGWGTDGKYDPNRIVKWIAQLNPDVISFNEMEKFNQYSLNVDGVALYQSLIEAKTGVKWYVWDIQDYGNWDDKGLRSVVFSKYPFLSTHRTVYSTGTLKTTGGATIAFNGRTINVMTTHLDPYSASQRATQASELVSYARGFAEDRIICGDFNDQSTNPPLTTMTAGYFDAWVEAKKAGIAITAPDNPNGNTRNSRIDYILFSRQEQHLTLKKVQVVDTRDANGVMPSDHRPVLAEFLVQ